MQINCFGDSLTAGTAWGNTMPYSAVLERLTGIKTKITESEANQVLQLLHGLGQ